MPYPSIYLSLKQKVTKKEATKTVDSLAYVAGVGGNVAVIPQIIKAWESEAPGLAVSTWLLFSLIGLIWLVYAILHQQKPLIVAQAVSISANLLVVGGWVFNNLIR
jgi:uncharacterized protein with PQ loop repeat